MKKYKAIINFNYDPDEIYEAENREEALNNVIDDIISNIGWYIDIELEEIEETEYED